MKNFGISNSICKIERTWLEFVENNVLNYATITKWFDAICEHLNGTPTEKKQCKWKWEEEEEEGNIKVEGEQEEESKEGKQSMKL